MVRDSGLAHVELLYDPAYAELPGFGDHAYDFEPGGVAEGSEHFSNIHQYMHIL